MYCVVLCSSYCLAINVQNEGMEQLGLRLHALDQAHLPASARINRVRRAHFRATPLCISDRYLTTFKVKQRPPKQDEFPEWCERPLQGGQGIRRLGTATV